MSLPKDGGIQVRVGIEMAVPRVSLKLLAEG
jgi:hypothetical protein